MEKQFFNICKERFVSIPLFSVPRKFCRLRPIPLAAQRWCPHPC